MPIKPENRGRYPRDWNQISEYIRFQRAHNRCEVCGIANYAVIKRLKHGKYRYLSQQEWNMVHARIQHSHSTMAESLKYHGFTKVVLTVGHLDHIPENSDYSNLKAMCQYCHNKYDREHRLQSRKKKYIGKNQISMF